MSSLGIGFADAMATGIKHKLMAKDVMHTQTDVLMAIA